jgi:hypothetical protein
MFCLMFSSEGSRLHPRSSQDASRVRRFALAIIVTRILDVPAPLSNPNEYFLINSEHVV